MAGNKYLEVGASTGLPTERAATQVSTGAPDANKIIAADANGLLDPSFLPPGVGISIDTIPASENLAAGDFVNKFLDSGTVKVRKADASNARRAHGFVRAAVIAPANATVYGPGENNDQLTGITGGTEYFLSTTVPGGVQTTLASTAGHIVQGVGVSSSTTAIRFVPSTPIVRA